MSVLWNFCGVSMIFKLSFFGKKLKTQTWKSRKTFILKSIKFKFFWSSFFDKNQNLSSFKTEINNNGLNLINLEVSEVLKRQLPAT